MNDTRIAVIGAGSWGTAIGLVLAKKHHIVKLWGYNRDHIESIQKQRENIKYMPGVRFPERLAAEADLEEAVAEADIVCMVVPSHGFRNVFKDVIRFTKNNVVFISATKGIENQNLKTMSQVMQDCLAQHDKEARVQTAVLSGPSFAKEVAAEMPTAITIGCKEKQTAVFLQKLFNSDYFRVYTSSDIIGLEISAALKNIIAVAAGICDGLGYGTNARAALITRGLAEMTRLGVKMGADLRTFYGLSGLGDLVLTCTGDLSRNRHVGLELGKGRSLDAILADMKMVAEGVKTTRAVHGLLLETDIEMPILEQVYNVLYERKNPQQAVQDLLNRDLREE